MAEKEYAQVDELLATMDDPAPSKTGFDPISIDEIFGAQFDDNFCVNCLRRLNNWERLCFIVEENGIFVRTGDKVNPIVALHYIKERIFYINHHFKPAAHPGGHKLYHGMGSDFYWTTLVFHCYASVRRCVAESIALNLGWTLSFHCTQRLHHWRQCASTSFTHSTRSWKRSRWISSRQRK